MSARDILLQIAQVVSVSPAFAPLLQGAIVQFEERVQRAQGPGLFQPYRDLWKLLYISSWWCCRPHRGSDWRRRSQPSPRC